MRAWSAALALILIWFFLDATIDRWAPLVGLPSQMGHSILFALPTVAASLLAYFAAGHMALKWLVLVLFISVTAPLINWVYSLNTPSADFQGLNGMTTFFVLILPIAMLTVSLGTVAGWLLKSISKES